MSCRLGWHKSAAARTSRMQARRPKKTQQRRDSKWRREALGKPREFKKFETNVKLYVKILSPQSGSACVAQWQSIRLVI
eukprot:164491-Amphidinium_carterae.1